MGNEPYLLHDNTPNKLSPIRLSYLIKKSQCLQTGRVNHNELASRNMVE